MKTRLPMRKIRDILRLRFECRLTIRQISISLRISTGVITKYLNLFSESGLSWPLPDEMDDTSLINQLTPEAINRRYQGLTDPDWIDIHRSLKQKGMTKQRLWEEYCDVYPHSHYSYAQFCHRYNEWRKKQKRSMRQEHRGGEKLFIDYAGLTVPIVSRETGETAPAQIFVAVLGASSYTYAEASWTQGLQDFLCSQARAFQFFGGVTQLLVPDNLRSAVSKACRYEPQINRSYQHLAEHFCTSIMPARPYKPKDKAKVEVGVQVVERWILMRLRHTRFFSLAELNQEIRRLLEDLNNRPFKQQPGCRRTLYEQLDQPALRPLPREACEYIEFKYARVNIDYHVQYGNHSYSVPHQLVREQVEIRAGQQLVQIFYKGKPVASHPRKWGTGFTTRTEHMPERHQKQQQWTPGRLLNWAKKLGPDVLWFTQQLLDSKEHPEQAYRACLGLLNMERAYGADRLNAACHRARNTGGRRVANVRSILQSGLDKIPLNKAETNDDARVTRSHENIRGASFYQ
ncbi:IS21 family transposase [Endozoicomonas sp. GU-1]|uniref:IS21 family transposase n=2 Tax=Endozoicomonas sp. GU-1 TaxID=3009078 RepID=UPI0022B5B43B|nr:IS21 family transposase [Endozoicomonas sp. GU-1]WBA83981.1 IS21 family transposase [Endozoicomonas sp. GU-1]WBA88869.1 IS21 family transposase [Endozoicomonas sp. GU-1]